MDCREPRPCKGTAAGSEQRGRFSLRAGTPADLQGQEGGQCSNVFYESSELKGGAPNPCPSNTRPEEQEDARLRKTRWGLCMHGNKSCTCI